MTTSQYTQYKVPETKVAEWSSAIIHHYHM